MWAWPGLYAPQLPQIRLLAAAISIFNKFQKFFRVVNGHAKTDFWLQQLFWLRPFFGLSGLKNLIFFSIFGRARSNFALGRFSILCQIPVGLDLNFA